MQATVSLEYSECIYSELRRRVVGGRDGYGNAERRPTTLVHEVWSQLAGQDKLTWCNRSHYFQVAARCLRQILVEQARSRLALKRATRWPPGPQDETPSLPEPELRILALDDAILALAAIEPRKSRAIELHYFAGLGTQEMADAMEVSTTTAQGDLRIAEAWVNRELTQRRVKRSE
jgi:RNA polymerase sigma-70 factor (ECF subfamily)